MEMAYSGYLFIFNINILFFKTSHSEFVCYIDLLSIFDHDDLKKCSSDQILTDSWFKKKKKKTLSNTHTTHNKLGTEVSFIYLIRNTYKNL